MAEGMADFFLRRALIRGNRINSTILKKIENTVVSLIRERTSTIRLFREHPNIFQQPRSRVMKPNGEFHYHHFSTKRNIPKFKILDIEVEQYCERLGKKHEST